MKEWNIYFLRWLLLVFCLASASPAGAIRLETGGGSTGLSFGINGFLGFEYTYMSKMPIVMDDKGTERIGTMPGASFLKLKHLNLLVSAEKENMRMLINLHTHDIGVAGSGHGRAREGVEIQEAYGEYLFKDLVRIRAGSFLAPFGIYNDVRYILPIFSSVVLPHIYDPPRNYSQAVKADEEIEPITPLTPEDGNLMVWGSTAKYEIDFRYHLYLSNGTNQNGGRQDRDLGVGGRILINAQDRFKIGASAYTVHNKGSLEGRARSFGGDLTFSPSAAFTFQAEYVVNRYAKQRSRYSYYLYAGFPHLQWLPYLRYDFLKDPEHLLMKRKQERYTLGLGYRFKSNLHLKGEYHHHRIVHDTGLPSNIANFDMLRLAIIMMF